MIKRDWAFRMKYMTNNKDFIFKLARVFLHINILRSTIAPPSQFEEITHVLVGIFCKYYTIDEYKHAYNAAIAERNKAYEYARS